MKFAVSRVDTMGVCGILKLKGSGMTPERQGWNFVPWGNWYREH
jgi:hypothetical protein